MVPAKCFPCCIDSSSATITLSYLVGVNEIPLMERAKYARESQDSSVQQLLGMNSFRC